jgi:outer membrane receptor protein involved in Fe transport
VTRNATRARIYGIESELLWKPAPDDVLQGVFTYLSAEYLDYPTVDTQYYVVHDPLTPVINLQATSCPSRRSSPRRWSTSIRSACANGARLVPRLQTKYQSEMYPDRLQPTVRRQRAYTRTDLSLRYESAAAG